MRTTLIIVLLLFAATSVFPQDAELSISRRAENALNKLDGIDAGNVTPAFNRYRRSDKDTSDTFRTEPIIDPSSAFDFEFPKERVAPIDVRRRFEFQNPQSTPFYDDSSKDKSYEPSMLEPHKKFESDFADTPKSAERFHWKMAIADSIVFLSIQHAFRMVQKKTRDELGGPFFKDWGNSAKNLGGWRDGDSLFTNYIAHPMQGAVTGRIFLNNSDKARKQEFGRSKDYWEGRAKALAWSAVWSAQFELGPISEASIGNVGLYDRQGPNRMGWVDLVITPFAGTLVIVAEDAIDKYVLDRWLERKVGDGIKLRLFRTFITPFQSFTNVLNGKRPWYRGNR